MATRSLDIPDLTNSITFTHGTRTQKEIRQRAPIWLVMLLAVNFVVMAVDARGRFAQQQTFKGFIQAAFSPIQTASSWVSTAGGGFFNQIINFRSSARENEALKERLRKRSSNSAISRKPNPKTIACRDCWH